MQEPTSLETNDSQYSDVYHEYPVINGRFPSEQVLRLKALASEVKIQDVKAEFLGTHTVADIPDHRIPIIRYRLIHKKHDGSSGEFDGFYEALILDGNKKILVSPDRVLEKQPQPELFSGKTV